PTISELSRSRWRADASGQAVQERPGPVRHRSTPLVLIALVRRKTASASRRVILWLGQGAQLVGADDPQLAGLELDDAALAQQPKNAVDVDRSEAGRLGDQSLGEGNAHLGA